MKQCQISVVITNYNYGRFLERALASVEAQRNVGAEIIVVDDGSLDDSRSVLEKYQGIANVIYQDNRGQAAAINAGVRASRGEFISFLDADDWWAPDKLTRILQAFESDSKVCLVYHRVQLVFSDGTYTGRPIPQTLCRGDLRRRLTNAGGWWPFPMTSAVAVRRSAWNEVGEIPETFRISADAWLVGIYPFVGHVAGVPSTLGFYRLHNNNWYRDKVEDAPIDQVEGLSEPSQSGIACELADHPNRLMCAAMRITTGADAGDRQRSTLARVPQSMIEIDPVWALKWD